MIKEWILSLIKYPGTAHELAAISREVVEMRRVASEAYREVAEIKMIMAEQELRAAARQAFLANQHALLLADLHLVGKSVLELKQQSITQVRANPKLETPAQADYMANGQ